MHATVMFDKTIENNASKPLWVGYQYKKQWENAERQNNKGFCISIQYQSRASIVGPNTWFLLLPHLAFLMTMLCTTFRK